MSGLSGADPAVLVRSARLADRDSLLAVNRFGLGAGPGEIAAVARDPRGWAVAMANRPPAPLPPTEAASIEAGLALFLARREALAQAAARPEAAAMATGMADGATAGSAARPPVVRGFTAVGETLNQALAARIEQAVHTPSPFEERLVLFWTDHFTASAASGFTGYFSDAYEREAIRPNVNGRFANMVRAAVLHPAMLFYLDNRNSTGPGSLLGLRSKGRRGLNENLGREALELHTLGVDGGYTQDDVIALAKVLTGWTVEIAPEFNGPSRFGFFENRHEPGPKTLLGKTYPQDGAAQAIAVLDDLARHPAAARHVTRRLVRHMVGHGLPGLEARMAEVFRRTDGDLGAVNRALVADEEAWGPLRKVRAPMELVLATARLMGGLPPQPPAVRALRAMGQPFWAAPSPKGWPIEDEAWAAPDAIKTRLDWASELAGRLPSRTDARALLETAFGPAASPETRRTIERAADGRQALTLLLLSPEFQRR